MLPRELSYPIKYLVEEQSLVTSWQFEREHQVVSLREPIIYKEYIYLMGISGEKHELKKITISFSFASDWPRKW